jgi:hypothetical protein
VRPGVYLVLIFDGAEGGSHSTWDYFHVLGAAPITPERAGGASSTVVMRGDGNATLALLAAGFLGGLVVGSGATAVVRRKHRAEQ